MANEYEIKKQICDIGKRIYNRNMVAANDGNISVKLNDHEFLCTPTGVSKGFMTPEYICKVDENGNCLQANGNFRPSSEIKMHMSCLLYTSPDGRIAENRPDHRQRIPGRLPGDVSRTGWHYRAKCPVSGPAVQGRDKYYRYYSDKTGRNGERRNRGGDPVRTGNTGEIYRCGREHRRFTEI